MSVEQRIPRAPLPRNVPHTYFIGRRPHEAAELYAVTADDVERLGSAHRYGEWGLDWHGSGAASLELSHLLLSRVAERRPSRELQARFALYVLARLPENGFVLDSDEIWRWLRLAIDADDFIPTNAPRQSWARRLRARFRRTATQSADV